jgi:hypothetical protein
MTEDVLMSDDVVLELSIDTDTGEQVDYRSNPELINVASGVVWNAHGSTLFRKCDMGADPHDILLSLFEDAVKLIPDGCAMTYATHSDWLYEQWSDIMGWKSVNYQSLGPNACPLQWKGIMEHIEWLVRDLVMVKLSDLEIDPMIRDAVILYAHEGIRWYRGLMATPAGGDYPPVAPWS